MIIPLINITEDFLLVILIRFLTSFGMTYSLCEARGKKRRFASDFKNFERYACESPLLPPVL
jgi:hypothetical protein